MATVVKKFYTGDNTATIFSFPFRIAFSTQVKVYVNGVLQTKDVDYTLVFTKNNGGTVTFGTAPALNAKIAILYYNVLEQVSSFAGSPRIEGRALDLQVYELYQLLRYLEARVLNCIQFPDYFDGSVLDTMDPTIIDVANAGKIVILNETGTGFEVSGYTVAQINQAVVDTTAAKEAAEDAQEAAEAAQSSAEDALSSANAAAIAAGEAQVAAENAQASVENALAGLVPVRYTFSGGQSATNLTGLVLDDAGGEFAKLICIGSRGTTLFDEFKVVFAKLSGSWELVQRPGIKDPLGLTFTITGNQVELAATAGDNGVLYVTKSTFNNNP